MKNKKRKSNHKCKNWIDILKIDCVSCARKHYEQTLGFKFNFFFEHWETIFQPNCLFPFLTLSYIIQTCAHNCELNLHIEICHQAFTLHRSAHPRRNVWADRFRYMSGSYFSFHLLVLFIKHLNWFNNQHVILFHKLVQWYSECLNKSNNFSIRNGLINPIGLIQFLFLCFNRKDHEEEVFSVLLSSSIRFHYDFDYDYTYNTYDLYENKLVNNSELFLRMFHPIPWNAPRPFPKKTQGSFRFIDFCWIFDLKNVLEYAFQQMKSISNNMSRAISNVVDVCFKNEKSAPKCLYYCIFHLNDFVQKFLLKHRPNQLIYLIVTTYEKNQKLKYKCLKHVVQQYIPIQTHSNFEQSSVSSIFASLPFNDQESKSDIVDIAVLLLEKNYQFSQHDSKELKQLSYKKLKEKIIQMLLDCTQDSNNKHITIVKSFINHYLFDKNVFSIIFQYMFEFY